METRVKKRFNSGWYSLIICTFILTLCAVSNASVCSVDSSGKGCFKDNSGKDSRYSNSCLPKRTFRRMFNTADFLNNNRSINCNAVNENNPIVITYEDLLTAYNPANDLEYYYTEDDSTYAMNIGKLDLVNPQHWVMPNATMLKDDTGVGIKVEDTPYKNQFPDATHCKYYSEEDEYDYYEYYTFHNDQIILTGAVNINYEEETTEVDTIDFLMAPVTLDIYSEFTAGDSVEIGEYFFEYEQDIYPYGFGTLTTPQGDLEVLVFGNDYYDALWKADTLLGETDETVLTFISKEGHMLSMTFVDDNTLEGELLVDWIEYTRIIYNPNSINTENELPLSFRLEQNYPNPFNPTTNIKYELKESGHVTLAVYDELGKEISILVNGEQSSGNHEVQYDGSNLSTGVYYYRLTQNNQSVTKKLMLMK